MNSVKTDNAVLSAVFHECNMIMLLMYKEFDIAHAKFVAELQKCRAGPGHRQGQQAG